MFHLRVVVFLLFQGFVYHFYICNLNVILSNIRPIISKSIDGCGPLFWVWTYRILAVLICLFDRFLGFGLLYCYCFFLYVFGFVYFTFI